MIYKHSVGRRDTLYFANQYCNITLKQSRTTPLCIYPKPPLSPNINVPSVSSIIVAAAALLSISAPIAAAKKDCREGTYYCGKDLLAIGNLLEHVATNATRSDLLTTAST